MKKLKLTFYFLLFTFYFLLASPIYAASATLSLSPALGNFNAGQEFDVQVRLNTGGGKTSGTDIYLNFNPNVLQLQDIIPGTLYDQYIGEEIDNLQGRAAISALANSVDELYQGTGVLATLKFKGNRSGTSQVSFNFAPEGKNDSNVADFEVQDDILTSVTGGSYQIESPAVGFVRRPKSTAVPQLPTAALSSPTLFVLITIIGVFLFAFGFYYFSRRRSRPRPQP